MSIKKLIQYLLVLSIILGLATVLTIRSIVPSFVVEGALIVLLLYLVSSFLLWKNRNRKVLVLPIFLSLFTIVSVFSTSMHVQLIEEGYLPAIVIISGGLISQSALLIACLVAFAKDALVTEQA